MSCMWQFSIWTAQGRLIYPISPDTPFTLKSWPNLTRLANVPGSIRLSAFLTKASVNLNVLYKVMPLNLNDILNYLAATYTTGFLSVDIMSCMWQFSIWTAQGRLIYPISPDTPFTLKSWPNLTRLANVPGSIRLSAFLTKASVNLNVLYKVMPLNLNDILNYLAATYTTGFLSVDLKTVSQQAYSDMADKINIGADSASKRLK